MDCRRTRRAPAALWTVCDSLRYRSRLTVTQNTSSRRSARSRLGSAAGFRGVMPPRGRAHCCSYLVLNPRGYSDSHTHMSNRRTPGPAALLRSGADIRGATRRDRRDRHDPRRSSAAVPRSRASKSRRPGAGPPRSAEFGSTCLLACRQVASGRHDDCVETASRRFKFTSQILGKGHELGVGALASGDPETARPHE